ncbi:MAG TPA: cytochrome c3 family protein [Firmicutes bacterium]|nr:cytochrome c3 family protein [Bacillota bacterium]
MVNGVPPKAVGPGRLILVLALTLALVLMLVAVEGTVFLAPALAKVAGSVHDFRSPENGGPNTAYPNLAALAGKDPCAACHRSHAAVKGAALFGEDYGWVPTSSRIALPNSTLCMSCHDGHAAFGTGQGDELAEHAIVKRHRRHRVEFPFPAPPGALPTPGRVVTDGRGRPAVEGPDGVLLPLYRDAATGQLKGGCGTCHEPHGPGTPYLLRTPSVRQLCPICHGAGKTTAPPAS